MKPDPFVVATKLLARKKMIDTGKQFNMIAASWIQFMIHDWIDHLEDTKQVLINTNLYIITKLSFEPRGWNADSNYFIMTYSKDIKTIKMHWAAVNILLYRDPFT